MENRSPAPTDSLSVQRDTSIKARPIYHTDVGRVVRGGGGIVPDVITAPYTPHFANLAWPTTYSELWGDYFGVWAWHGVPTPSSDFIYTALKPFLMGRAAAG